MRKENFLITFRKLILEINFLTKRHVPFETYESGRRKINDEKFHSNVWKVYTNF